MHYARKLAVLDRDTPLLCLASVCGKSDALQLIFLTPDDIRAECTAGAVSLCGILSAVKPRIGRMLPLGSCNLRLRARQLL